MVARQYFEEDPQRFVNYAFEQDSRISNFNDFKKAFYSAFNTNNGSHLNVSEEDLIYLYKTSECQRRVQRNQTDEERQKEKETYNNQSGTTSRQERVAVRSYNSKGRTVKGYNRGKSQKYTKAQEKFISVRKQKGIKPSQITKEYNKAYPDQPRTKQSIKSKSRRV